MATPAQINANRNNAKKSTGPKTPEGRAAARLNGLKHGLASDILVLEGESESDFENLLDSLEAEHGWSKNVIDLLDEPRFRRVLTCCSRVFGRLSGSDLCFLQQRQNNRKHQ